MADNTTLNTGTGGDVIATDDIGGVKHQLVKIEYGALDSATLVSAANPLPIVQTGTPALPTGAATSANQLPNNHNVVVTSAPTTAVTGPLTDAQLRASAVPVSLTSTTVTGSVAVTGPLTDAQLRATPLPVSGTVTANAGTNLNTSALALDSTVAKDSSLSTLNTSVNTLLKPANTLAGVTTVGTVTSITNPVTVTNAGTFAVQDTSTATTSTQTSVANSVTNVTLLSLNASRKSATIYNDDTAASLYVKFGTTASATSFKIKIAPGGYYEFPLPIYTGRVDGIATAATGSARICEDS